MDHALLMRVLHRIANAVEEFQYLWQRELSFTNISVDAHAANVIHDVIGRAFGGGTGIEDRHDVRMLKLRLQFDLALEALQRRFGRKASSQHEFDGDLALRRFLKCLIHNALAAAMNLAENFVTGDRGRDIADGTDRRRCRCVRNSDVAGCRRGR